jgi:orotate phosphoribosyltransferase
VTEALFHPFLRDANCVTFGKPAVTGEIARCPYHFQTPRPFTGAQLAAMHKAATERVRIPDACRSVNIVGVASGGLAMSTIVASAIATRYTGVSCRLFSGFADRPEIVEGFGSNYCADFTLVVDNAIRSGQTARTILDGLRRYGCQPVTIFVLFDRCLLVDGVGEFERLARLLGVQVVGLLSVHDLVEATEETEQRVAMLEHVADCCSLRGSP